MKLEKKTKRNVCLSAFQYKIMCVNNLECIKKEYMCVWERNRGPESLPARFKCVQFMLQALWLTLNPTFSQLNMFCIWTKPARTIGKLAKQKKQNKKFSNQNENTYSYVVMSMRVFFILRNSKLTEKNWDYLLIFFIIGATYKYLISFFVFPSFTGSRFLLIEFLVRIDGTWLSLSTKKNESRETYPILTDLDPIVTTNQFARILCVISER